MLSGLAAAAAGCGKKWFTVASRPCQAIGTVETCRVGDEVFLTSPVPNQNIDMSRPADVARIDVYAVTTTEPRPPNRLLEGATLVGVVNVDTGGTPGTTPLPPPPVPGAIPPASQPLPVQGNTVTVQERLEPRPAGPCPAGGAPWTAAAATAILDACRPVAPAAHLRGRGSARGRSGPPAPRGGVAGHAAGAVSTRWRRCSLPTLLRCRGSLGRADQFPARQAVAHRGAPVDDEAAARRAAAAAPAVWCCWA